MIALVIFSEVPGQRSALIAAERLIGGPLRRMRVFVSDRLCRVDTFV
jgi:hypothetical protein